MGVTAVVRVTLKDGTFHEDVGYGTAEMPKRGQAIEKAKKEAVSDARKRVLRLYGDALGNCLYDKNHLKRIKSTAGNQGEDMLDISTLARIKLEQNGIIPAELVNVKNEQSNGRFQPYQTSPPKITPAQQTGTTKTFSNAKPLPPPAQFKPLPKASLPPPKPQPVQNYAEFNESEFDGLDMSAFDENISVV